MIATSSGLGRYKNIVSALSKLGPKIGGNALLKPNLVAGGLAATHVDAVRAVLDSLDIKVIAEGSGVDTSKLYSILGYHKLAHEYGVDLVDLNQTSEWDRTVKFETIDGRKTNIRVSDYARRYEIVSLALPKTHDHAIVTLTIKNMLGFVHPEDKSLVHGYVANFGKLMKIPPFRKIASLFSGVKSLSRMYSSTEVEQTQFVFGAKIIHKNIAALINFAKPKLGVIDGFVGMQGDGPVGGEKVEWNIAIAGNPIECDVYCAHKMGFDPADVGYLVHLAAPRVSDIQITGDDVPKKRFKPHRKYELQLMWKKV
jgi:uncharacterized protein (DUF362 family)